MTQHSRTRRTWMAAAGIAAALAVGAGGATLVSAQGTVTAGPPSMFSTTTPVRILDTRTGTGTGVVAKIGPGQTTTVDLSALLPDFDPLAVNAVVVNVGVEAPSQRSYVALVPFGTAPGSTSTVNFDPQQTIANQAIVGLVDGKFDVYNAVGSTEVFIDLLGAYGDAQPG